MRCSVCGSNKQDTEFYRTDVEHPRCKECCRKTTYCRICKKGCSNECFTVNKSKCDDCCGFGQSRAVATPLGPKEYVIQQLENHDRWLLVHALPPCHIQTAHGTRE